MSIFTCTSIFKYLPTNILQKEYREIFILLLPSSGTPNFTYTTFQRIKEDQTMTRSFFWVARLCIGKIHKSELFLKRTLDCLPKSITWLWCWVFPGQGPIWPFGNIGSIWVPTNPVNLQEELPSMTYICSQDCTIQFPQTWLLNIHF